MPLVAMLPPHAGVTAVTFDEADKSLDVVNGREEAVNKYCEAKNQVDPTSCKN